MAKNKEKKIVKAPKAPKGNKPAPENDAPKGSEPQGVEQASETETALAATVLPGTLSAGMVSYLVHDIATGSVFVSEQKSERAYLAAVVADSPLGRKCVRLTSDHKAALRYARAINEKGASACSNAVVLPVIVDDKPHRESIAAGLESWVTRNRKAAWDNAAQAAREAIEASASVE
jgi:hypothetical protein